MNPPVTSRRDSPLAMLRRFARAPGVQTEQCELCRVAVGPGHRHLLEMQTSQIVCACDGCALRFEGVADGRFKLIPRDTRPLPDFQLTDPQWESLALPINMAFFLFRTPQAKLCAYYPSPGGAVESLLPLTSWEVLRADNPVLNDLEADVQALLVNRISAAREYYLAPIDVCFELVGLIRLHWRGLSGGDAVWQEVEGLFARLKSESGTGFQLAVEEVDGHEARPGRLEPCTSQKGTDA